MPANPASCHRTAAVNDFTLAYIREYVKCTAPAQKYPPQDEGD